MAGPFTRMYQWTLQASRHRHAEWWLGGVSVAESSFFPVPVDVMLAPMTLARPERAWRLAFLTTVCSVAGGVIGYLIGVFLIDAVMPLVQRVGYEERYLTAVSWFQRYGFWAILVAGFTPIPYKVFTIAAGTVGMPFAVFVAGSVVGRGARFFMVAGLVRWLGPTVEARLFRYIDAIGWGTLALIVFGLIIYGLRG